MLGSRQQEYINRILDGLWGGSGPGAIFLHAEGSIPEYLVERAASAGNETVRVLRYRLSSEGFNPPFHPFLSVIRAALEDEAGLKPQRMIDDSGMYAAHRGIFRSWLVEGRAQREGELLLEEYPYEVDRMLESLWLLLDRSCRKTRVLVLIEDLARIEPSTAHFLSYLLDRGLPARMKLLACVDGRTGLRRRGMAGVGGSIAADAVEDFFSRISVENRLVSLDGSGGDTLPMQSAEQPPLPPGRGGSSLLDSCRDALSFLALNECVEWSERLLAAFAEGHVALGEDEIDLLTGTLGDAYYLSGQYDAALLRYQSLLPRAQRRGKGVSAAYRRIGAVSLRKDNVEGAHQYALQAMKLAEDSDDGLELFRALFLLFTIEDRTRKQAPDKWRAFYRRILDLARKLGQEDALAYLYTNPYGLYSQYTLENMRRHVQGQRIARKRDNLFRQATSWQTLGLVYSVKGKYERVLKCYRRSEELKLKLGNPLELCYINNGIGFYEYMTGNYPEADRRYHRALGYLRTLHDYHETVMTLFNVASNRFFAFYHEEAADVLEKMLVIIRMFEMRVLAYHSLFGMYCLLALAHLKSGKSARAYEYLAAIESRDLKPYPGKNEEYFQFELLQALLASVEGRHADADGFFSRARDYLLRENDIIIYMAPRFFWEWGKALRTRGDSKGAAGVMAEGASWAEKLGNSLYRRVFALERQDLSYDPRLDAFDGVQVDFPTIFEFVRLEKNLNVLHRKNAEINFLNTLQSVLGERARREALVEKVMRLINASFIMEHCHYFARTEARAPDGGNYGRWSCDFALTPRASFDARGLASHLAEGGKPRLLTRRSDYADFEAYAPLLNTVICVPLSSEGELKGALLCATEREDLSLTGDDLSILSIACRQFLAALDKLEHEEEIVRKNAELSEAAQKLEVMADTDLLTGLYNRQALSRRLDEEGKRLSRINLAHRPGLAICFMDLDNFKYYNDSYGQAAGDAILREFAALIKKQAREIDYAARWGGDEFVLVLPETGKAGAIHLTSRLLKALKAADSFRAQIESVTGKSVQIPEDCEITCSVGIYAYPPEGQMDPEQALRLANDAAYQAKSLGQGGYVVASN